MALEDLNGGSNAGKDLSNGGGMTEYKILSYFGRINYSLMDRYLLEANIRADASSRFIKITVGIFSFILCRLAYYRRRFYKRFESELVE